MRIALDAMGSDAGSTPLVEGAVMAARRFDCRVLMVGKRHSLQRLLTHFRYKGDAIEVVPCARAIKMGDHPSESLQARDSSIAVATRLVHEGGADALVSAGNTGATLAHAMTSWRRLKGINRPGIAVLMPTTEQPCLVLDVGANVDCKPRHLLDFALMGSVYAREVLRRPNPTVGLLSCGAEPTKGNALTLSAFALLEKSHLNFVGNVEPRRVLKGKVDVAVCDGFVGNVFLKTAESLANLVMAGVKGVMTRNVFSLAGALMMSPGLKVYKRKIDASEYGGAPLLGLNGTCIIGHGASTAKAVMNAIRVAMESVKHRVNEHISGELELINEEIAADAGAAEEAKAAQVAP